MMPIPTPAQLDEWTEYAKTEVLNDIAEGTLPTSVAGFSELHDHVDANDYVENVPFGGELATAEDPHGVRFVALVQDRVTAMLADRARIVAEKNARIVAEPREEGGVTVRAGSAVVTVYFDGDELQVEVLEGDELNLRVHPSEWLPPVVRTGGCWS